MSALTRTAHLASYKSLSVLSKRKYGFPMRFPIKGYDEMTIPSGSWKAYNDKLSSQYNLPLLTGLAVMSVAWIGCYIMANGDQYRPKQRSNTPEGLSFLNVDKGIVDSLLRE